MSFCARMNIADAQATGGGSGGGGAFTITCSPTSLVNSGAGGSSGAKGPIVATPSGGVAPYSYAWSLLAYTGDSGHITITSPSSASSTFTIAGVLGQDTGSATVRMTCTDSVGNPAVFDCTVSWFNTDVAP